MEIGIYDMNFNKMHGNLSFNPSSVESRVFLKKTWLIIRKFVSTLLHVLQIFLFFPRIFPKLFFECGNEVFNL